MKSVLRIQTLCFLIHSNSVFIAGVLFESYVTIIDIPIKAEMYATLFSWSPITKALSFIFRVLAQSEEVLKSVV